MRRVTLGLGAALGLLLALFWLSTPAQAYCRCGYGYHSPYYGGGYHAGWGWHGGWHRGWGYHGAPGVGRYGSGVGWRRGVGVGAPGLGWRRGRG